ncbi:hypothetical protein ACO0LC_11140 [Undibacterium sp. JH2W]|uniref:hypothetical protein n=1 Tax=Undibacterium sp. JH2W TaxID=3413037 RepID=UPI003BF0971A
MFSFSVKTSERFTLLSQFAKVCEDAHPQKDKQYPVALTVDSNGECIYDAWNPVSWKAAHTFLKRAEREKIIVIDYPKTRPEEIAELD